MARKKKEREEDLLKNEHIQRVLSPHPLSFMKLQSLCLFLIIWGVVVGWLVNFSEWKDLFSGNEWLPVLAWGLVLLLVGVVASLTAIRWSIFFLYLTVFVCALGLMLWQNWLKDSALFIPMFSVAVSIVGFLMVELYRRSHKYVVSNLRITFKGGIFTKEERTVRYDKITDINAKQGILGQIFGFGTIIPITQAGFGLGSDKSFAAGGVELSGGKKAKLLGIAGGGKEVQTPRARSYYELHGIYPYKEIKKLIENLVQDNVITPYQQEQVEFQKQQVDIQKQMRDLLKTQTKTTRERPAAALAKMRQEEDEEEEEEPEEQEEAFEQEQVDVQKQMKNLLKKQLEVKEKSAEEQDEEETEEKK